MIKCRFDPTFDDYTYPVQLTHSNAPPAPHPSDHHHLTQNFLIIHQIKQKTPLHEETRT
jgi:hypothetical protein